MSASSLVNRPSWTALPKDIHLQKLGGKRTASFWTPQDQIDACSPTVLSIWLGQKDRREFTNALQLCPKLELSYRKQLPWLLQVKGVDKKQPVSVLPTVSRCYPRIGVPRKTIFQKLKKQGAANEPSARLLWPPVFSIFERLFFSELRS